MKVIIPAAGIGTRLRPHTHSLPKALLHVAGRPIIAHILEDVSGLKPSGVALIVGYKGELIKEYVLREFPGMKIDFVFQSVRRGIGHAVHLTREVADKGEPVLIILGDTIIKTDLERVVASTTNVLGVKEVDDPRRFGICDVRNGRIVRLIEKPEHPTGNLAIVGLYYLLDSLLLFEVLQEQIDKKIKNRGEFQITDALQMMIEKGTEFRPFEIHDWFDCGKPEALLETNRYLLERRTEIPAIKGSVIIPPVSIAPSARIEHSIIGPYASIAPGVVVVNSIIRDSVVDEGAKVTNSLLENSLVGARAEIEGGFKRLNVGDSSKVAFK